MARIRPRHLGQSRQGRKNVAHPDSVGVGICVRTDAQAPKGRHTVTQMCRPFGTSINPMDAPQIYPGQLLQIISKHHAALHHEFHALHFGDVFERVAGNGYKVREPSFFDVADLLA
jgi:hypothetical protein